MVFVARSARRAALLTVLASSPVLAQARPGAPAATKPAISAADLRTRLFIYADDSMMGREAGKIGNAKATAYIAAEVRRLGLEPAGDSGSYFQNVPLVQTALDTSSHLAVDSTMLTAWTDFAPISPDLGLPIKGYAKLDGLAIYAGRVNNPTLTDSVPFAGKIIVLGAALGPDGRGLFALSPQVIMHFAGAASVMVVVLDYAPPGILAFLQHAESRLFGDAPAEAPGPPVTLISGRTAALMFDAPLDSLAAGTAGHQVRGRIMFGDEPTPAPARNVVAVLRGSDPVLRNEYVALGAHNDHIGMTDAPVEHDSIWAFNHVLRPEGAETAPHEITPEQWMRVNAVKDSMRKIEPPHPDSVFNGADDDGSGTVTVLELAEDLASSRVKPKRSILFVWHVGEEEGLYGSQWFTDHPTVPRDAIVAQLNIDMIGRGSAADIEGGGPNYLQLIGSRRLSTELGDLVERVNTSGKHGFAFDYQYDADGHPQQYYCRSDHYEYARYGIPIVFFSTGSHPDYHMLTDEAQYIDYYHMARVAGLIEDIALHVADLDHRVVVDHPKPDPNGICRQ